MRTRRANYPTPSDGITFNIRPIFRKRPQLVMKDINDRPKKMNRVTRLKNDSNDGINALSDDLLIAIITCVGSTASSPADLVNAMLTAAVPAIEVKARAWSEGAHRFLKKCAGAGNIEACYMLGMIRFYCLGYRGAGASLMSKAAMVAHTSALHSLAIIQFNGSGGIRKDKDLKAGMILCAKAAALGHVDAIRELGHCLQDGYGVLQNVVEGRRLLLEANAREAAAAVVASPRSFVQSVLQTMANPLRLTCPHHSFPFHSVLNKAQVIQRALLDHSGNFVSIGADRRPIFRFLHNGACSLLSDFGCNLPPPKLHAANRFLVDWFSLHPPSCGLRLCSHGNCGRLETRKHEFRRCSACGSVNYCSRACQALDWKVRHKYHCRPVVDWEARQVHGANL
ncbi:hypothetical protein O6H91_22G026700 [Diphasiastrum complanatum]|uniref:Uncharacterized protein n=1 Tax=Diphasiastrum complanatum TaxID=34168 RepID=A0ACC2ADV3_DIPCM|nr:hypothetical protein O6H91_22G026700 [Diphasiastrum complanatum]